MTSFPMPSPGSQAMRCFAMFTPSPRKTFAPPAAGSTIQRLLHEFLGLEAIRFVAQLPERL
ncbi:MAG TPA: hypothetical protein VIC87_06260, partial [Vicinamibacteria bacterium]